MHQVHDPGERHYCPMHPEVRHPHAGKCPKCGMALVPEGARFGMLRHMLKSPLLLTVMTVLMAVMMAIVMMRW